MTSQTDHVVVSDERAATAGIPSRSSRSPASLRVRLRLVDLLLPAGIAFWAGVVLILVSAAVELGRDHVSGWRMALHAVALTVMLYGTAPLVYSQGRYSWLYKTIGVVQYVNVNGRLNSTIDIYQNWPGFFAFAAW